MAAMSAFIKNLKHSGYQIALLGLLVFGLILAWWMVKAHSTVRLCDPVRLPHTGLATPICRGNNWDSDEKWHRQDNRFILSSIKRTRSAPIKAGASWWTYHLAPSIEQWPQLLEEKLSSYGGTVVKTGQFKKNSLKFNWAHIKKTGLNVYFASARLPGRRRLALELLDRGSGQPAEKTFQMLLNNVRFEDNQLLSHGKTVIEQIKQRGIADFSPNRNQQKYFLISDNENRNIGFTMEVLVNYGDENQLNIHGVDFVYTTLSESRQNLTFFRSDNRFDQYALKNETTGKNPTAIDMVIDKTNTATILKKGYETTEKFLHLTPASIPDSLFDLVLRNMLDGDLQKAVVDIIQPDGRIIPAFITVIDPAEVSASTERAASAFRVELLNDENSHQVVLFDETDRIIRKIYAQKIPFILRRTTFDKLLGSFPEKADYILDKKKNLTGNTL